MGENLWNGMYVKSLNSEEKVDDFDYIKDWSFCTTEDSAGQADRQSRMGRSDVQGRQHKQLSTHNTQRITNQ